MKHDNTLRHALTLLAVAALGTVQLLAYSPERYAASSRLASGKWAKIRVNEGGMQFLSNSQIRNLGFSDPSKVRVYGYGGRMIRETLDDRHPDDLPLLPCVHTSKGIVFYGVDNIGWQGDSKGSAQGGSKYSRIQNPYATASYYFISDADTQDEPKGVMPAGTASSQPKTTFTAHLLHEKELAAGCVSGRELFGEDFRTKAAQSFPFTLTGYAGGEAKVNVRFATTTSSGASTVSVYGNGTHLGPGDMTIREAASKVYLVAGSAVKTVENPGEKLDVELRFKTSGVLRMARLDYIIVEYERELRLSGAELMFYDYTSAPTAYTVAGCTESTVIWDVTDPESPLLVQGDRQGDRITFTASQTGYREYVAFDADKVSRTVTPSGSVVNQDIHAMETPDMLIITPQQYRAQSERIAQMHRDKDGMTVHVLTPEALYNEFSSGTPDVSAFRKALKMWYDRGGGEGGKLKHCLIMSRPTYDNRMITDAVRSAGYPRVLQWQSQETYTESSSYGTDDFIVMLDDVTDGKFNMNKARISLGIGRFEVKSLTEATQMVDKLLNYVNTPRSGSWKNTVMLLADDQDRAVHMVQTENLWNGMRSAGNGANFNYEKVYMDAYPLEASSVGMHYPQAKARMKQLIQEGVDVWSYIGHASPRGLSHEDMFNWTDITSMTNRNLPFMYAATCEFVRPDDDEISGAEIMWLYPDSGVIAMIAASRSVYISDNGIFSEAMGRYFFSRDADGKAIRMGDLLRLAKNATNDGGNKLRFLLMGDPALRVPSPDKYVVVDRIGDTDMTVGREMPQVGALEKFTVEGRVVDSNGNTLDDFNGNVDLILFDAEMPVETYGNGDEGEPYTYNDRQSRLFRSVEKVTGGRWTATVLTPALIENNYSPARLSLYAYSDSGVEANGACERLYVYGFDPDATRADDTEGPVISGLCLNSEAFASGDIVNQSPVVRASMRDDSGISVYGSTIGHQITIKVDDQVYNDVSDFYSPAEGDPYGGSILYPLNSVEPGEHTLTLTVYDNMGNDSSQTIAFRVAVGRAPGITDVYTDVNPARTSVNFIINHDRPSEALQCTVDVYNLAGSKVWSNTVSTSSDYDTSLRIGWDLCDGGGGRVPRGIYLYRVTITDASGAESSVAKKLAVTAP